LRAFLVKSKSQKTRIGGAENTIEPTPATNTNAELLTDETAAAYIGGIESRTVRDWRMRRGLPFIRVTAKVIRIRRDDLDKWIARHVVAIRRGVA
jgi:excisionase family DNA binding protein